MASSEFDARLFSNIHIPRLRKHLCAACPILCYVDDLHAASADLTGLGARRRYAVS